jgi:hypothetical protein
LVPCKHLLDFTLIVFALELISEKKEKKTYLTGPSPKARPSLHPDPTRSANPVARPGGAHLAKPEAAAAARRLPAGLGVRAWGA